MGLDRKTFRQILLIALIAVAFGVAISHLSAIAEAFVWLWDLLLPFFIGIIGVVVMNPVVLFFSNLLDRIRKPKRSGGRVLRRAICIILTLLLFLGIFTVLGLILAPQLGDTLAKALNVLPGYAQEFLKWLTTTIPSLDLSEIQLPESDLNWNSLVNAIVQSLDDGLEKVLANLFDYSISVVAKGIKTIFGVAIAIYTLAIKERILRLLRRMTESFLPEKAANKVFEIAALTNKTFHDFVIGQLLEAVIIGTICLIGTSILGLPYAVLVSAIMGIAALVPVIGPWTGAAISVLLIFSVDPLQALFFLIFIVAVELTERYFIYPRVVGNSIGVPGLLILSAVLIGAGVAGIIGVLLAVPVFSILYALLKRELAAREAKQE